MSGQAVFYVLTLTTDQSSLQYGYTYFHIYMLANPRYKALLSYAYDNRIKSADLARGCCFDASIALARQARALGLGEELQFIRWHVPRDPHFRDHWALSFGTEHALDVSAVQIDGNSEPLRSLQSYVGHVTDRHLYPLEVILRAIDAHPHTSGDTYSPGLMWRVMLSLAQYDGRQALKHLSPLALWRVLMDTVHATLVIGAVHWHDRLLQHLATRLSAKP